MNSFTGGLIVGIISELFLFYMIGFTLENRNKHKHNWELIKEQQEGYIRYKRGQKYGNFTVFYKAYKCTECGEFKFWYSHDMMDGDCFEKRKELFEFDIINNINGE